MGWFWSSSNGDASDNASTTSPVRPSPPPLPQTYQKSEPKHASGTDEEVAKFLSMIQEAHNPPLKQQPPSKPEPVEPAPAAPEKSILGTVKSWMPANPLYAPAPEPVGAKPAKPRSPQSLAISETQLPSTMSCQDAFDYAWHCHTPGSQLNSVYRVGSLRPCSELWDDFWFCMRTKSWAPEARAEAIKDHFRKKEEQKYGGGNPSSEDVWESRDSLVEPGTAFKTPFDPPITDDREFERQEEARRQWLRDLDEERKRNEGK
ncbi:hypothetical protein QBC38DRAFT_484278 [Podospora fimiseda]|uniref:Early meiotic induction protein 1 n=1 Tax=Podospora fimiseda TaxID=252190 RepID=A0AAN7BKK7_9PEZI|nr:hypothetical protein QBC38DRAFT_484278 [Podospora fimiseda]